MKGVNKAEVENGGRSRMYKTDTAFNQTITTSVRYLFNEKYLISTSCRSLCLTTQTSMTNTVFF